VHTTWIRLVERLEPWDGGGVARLGYLVNKQPGVPKKLLLSTNVTFGLLADVEIGHVPLVPFAQLGIHLVVQILRPQDQVLGVGGRLVLGRTLGTPYKLAEVFHEVPSSIVERKVVHKAPVRRSVEHLLLL